SASSSSLITVLPLSCSGSLYAPRRRPSTAIPVTTSPLSVCSSADHTAIAAVTNQKLMDKMKHTDTTARTPHCCH
ncbi:hypothetical protein L195_g044384, partial [Trifolium pratense]